MHSSDHNLSSDPFDCLCDFLRDPATGWSLGTFGALAEFSRTENEKITINERPDYIEAITELGAIRIFNHPELRILPYEILSKLENAWSQGVVVCLPAASANGAGRTSITDLGPDPASLVNLQKEERLFDLGLNVSHIDFCIRTNNTHLINTLSAAKGRSLFPDEGNLIENIRKTHPTRVFSSQLGRIEVYQDIPSGKNGAETPEGPHSHLIPELLAHKRTHAANLPVPTGWLPSLAFYPPNSIRTTDGEVRSFDEAAHQRFQNLLMRFADPGIIALKKKVAEALSRGQTPEDYPTPETRAERTALRVALRQWHHTNGPSSILDRWKTAYEPNANSKL